MKCSRCRHLRHKSPDNFGRVSYSTHLLIKTPYTNAFDVLSFELTLLSPSYKSM